MKAEEAVKREKPENIFSQEVWAQFKKVKREFSRSVAPQVRENAFFLSNSEKRARKEKRGRKNNRTSYFIDLPPLAASLTRDFYSLQRAAAQMVAKDYQRLPEASSVAEKGKIVRVFVILEFQTDLVKYHLQKIERKSRPGFPGGEIKDGESVMEAGTRETKEETNPDPDGGVNISVYNPMEVATFLLNGAVNEEKGVILFVKLPKAEISKIQPGGGDKEKGEKVPHVYLATSDQLDELVASQEILPNSATIWQLFKKFRDI